MPKKATTVERTAEPPKKQTAAEALKLGKFKDAGKPKQIEQAKQNAPETRALATVPKGGAVATADADFAAMLLQDAQQNTAQFGKEDLAIPRLRIIQKTSPLLDRRAAEYNENAVEGSIANSATGEFYDGEEGIDLVLISYRRTHIERTSRRNGGKFVKDHGLDDSILDRARKNEATGALELPNGNTVSTVAEYFAFLVDENLNIIAPVVLSMSGTQLKKSRRLNTLIRQLRAPLPGSPGSDFNPPMYYRVYRFRANDPEQNDQGSWVGWKIEPGSFILDYPNGKDVYMQAREYYAKIERGEVKVAPVSEVIDAEPVSGSGGNDDDAAF